MPSPQNPPIKTLVVLIRVKKYSEKLHPVSYLSTRVLFIVQVLPRAKGLGFL